MKGIWPLCCTVWLRLGLTGLNFWAFFGHSAQQVRAMLDREGLEALGNHVPFGELSARPQEVLEFHRQVGCRFLTVSELPLEEFGAVSGRLDELAQKASQAGIRLLYHNHDGELIEHKEGMEVLEYILTHTRPQSLALEPGSGDGFGLDRNWRRQLRALSEGLCGPLSGYPSQGLLCFRYF